MADVKNFDLKIISPNKNQQFQVQWVDVQSPTGNFLVGPNHDSLVSILQERSKLTYRNVESLQPESFDVYGGLFKIENNKALIILDL